MTAPLAGIRVVEIASFVAAPAAGALLADMGADVIKVEVPQGEVMRASRPRAMGIRQSDFPEAPHFHMDNRGKRSLALDITRDDHRAALHRVLEGADVVITNMLPQRQKKYGIDAETLRAGKPSLVFGTLSGYGTKGEDATTPAFDYTAYWGRTGFMDLMRDEGSAPAFLRPGVGDHAAALALVAGILAALRVRDQTGEGQVVDVNLMHTGFYILGNDTTLALATGEAPPNHDRSRPRNPLWNHYQARDGRFLFLVMIESDRYWPKVCRALGLEGLVHDERFAGAVARYRNSEVLTARIAAEIARRTLAEWRAILPEHGLIFAPVETLVEAVNDPQARAAGCFQSIRHPRVGEFETVAPPIHMSLSDLRSDRAGPDLGADSRDILAEAGFSASEIEALVGGA